MQKQIQFGLRSLLMVAAYYAVTFGLAAWLHSRWHYSSMLPLLVALWTLPLLHLLKPHVLIRLTCLFAPTLAVWNLVFAWGIVEKTIIVNRWTENSIFSTYLVLILALVVSLRRNRTSDGFWRDFGGAFGRAFEFERKEKNSP